MPKLKMSEILVMHALHDIPSRLFRAKPDKRDKAIKLEKNEILVMRDVNSDMTSHNDFKWPEEGPVEAPDWYPEPVCGGGLHGLPWGEGGNSDYRINKGRVTLLVAVDTSPDNYMYGSGPLTDKCKFHRGRVVFCGPQEEAVKILQQHAPPNTAINWVQQCTPLDKQQQIGGNGSTQKAGNNSVQTAGIMCNQAAGNRSMQKAAHYSTQTADNCSTQTADNNSTQTAGHSSTQTATYRSTQTAGYRSTQTAGDRSTQTAGSHSTQKAGDSSEQKAGDNSTQTAGDSSRQEAGHFSMQKAGNYSTQKAGDDSTQTAGGYSTQTAGSYSTQEAGNNSIQTAGEGTVQIGRWSNKVAIRVVTAEMEGKPYLFKDGEWTLFTGIEPA